MKAFRFRLQSVLSLREEKEQTAQREVARALHGVAVIETALAGVAKELAGLGNDLLGRLQAGMPARALAELGAYREVLSERRARLRRDLAQAQETVRQARVVLLQASQERQALDTYRDKRRRAHDLEAAREEQKTLDELAGRVSAFGGLRHATPAVSPS